MIADLTSKATEHEASLPPERPNHARAHLGAYHRLQPGGERPLIVDVCGAEKFAGRLGQPAGAVNVPAAELCRRLSEINDSRGKPVFVVCRAEWRSVVAPAI